LIPFYRNFGIQDSKIGYKPVHYLSEEMYEEFCAFATKGNAGALRYKYNESILLITEDYSQSCYGKIGLFSSFAHLHQWCALGADMVWFTDPNELYHFFAGYYVNMHEGTKFQALYDEDPRLRDCVFIQAEVGTPESRAFVEKVASVPLNSSEQVFLSVSTYADNEVVRRYDSIMTQFLFRVIIAGLFYYASLRSWYYIYLDEGKLSKTHRLVLWINGISMAVLGSIEALGTHYIFDVISVQTQDVFFLLLFGTSVATDFLLAVLYQRVTSYLQNSRQSERGRCISPFFKQCIFIGVAVIIIFIDISAAVLQYFSHADLYDLLFIVFPLLFISLQAFVIIYLVKQTFTLVHFFRTSAKLSKSVYNKAQYEAMVKLERRFRLWVSISVSCASLSIVLFSLYHTLVVMRTQTDWIVFWFFFALAKFGNVIAQVEVCKPPKKSAENENINKGRGASAFNFDSSLHELSRNGMKNQFLSSNGVRAGSASGNVFKQGKQRGSAESDEELLDSPEGSQQLGSDKELLGSIPPEIEKDIRIITNDSTSDFGGVENPVVQSPQLADEAQVIRIDNIEEEKEKEKIVIV